MGFMAKNRNKGFSLIEVIIGVAVLTILLTPVVKQLAQTMRTNRLAKEQQYANESATNVLEYAQKTSFNDLKVIGNSGDVYVKSVSSQNRTCSIYVYNSTDNSVKPIDDYASQPGLIVNYGVTSYEMNDVELGSRKTEYTRTLLLDDLSNKISSFEFIDKVDATKKHGLRVVYDQTGTVPISDDMKNAGFARTTEGSIVQYTTDTDGTYISGIVCELKDYDKIINDPNTTKQGTMLNLKSTQVALVNGDSTNFDKQAEEDLYAAALAYLKENNPVRYEQVVNGKGNPLDEAGYLNDLHKTTTIRIDKGVDVNEPYYLIKVDVAYSNSVVNFEYNVFSQKFKYEDKKDDEGNSTGWTPTVPAVYMEYQPFSVDGRDYSAEEYIFIENFVDGAKIYLYKPMKDLGYMTTTTGATVENQLENVVDKNPDGEGYYVINDSRIKSSRVKLHINMLDSTNASSESTRGKSTYIYTNIVDKENNSTSINSSQFDTSLIAANRSIYNSTDYLAFEQVITDSKTQTAQENKSVLYLQDVYADMSEEERLYTATVILEPKEDGVNTVTLTGAKGGR